VRGLGEKRDRVREVPADSFHHREGRENDQCRDEALAAPLVPMIMPVVVAVAASAMRVVHMPGVLGVVVVKIVRHVGLPVVNPMSA